MKAEHRPRVLHFIDSAGIYGAEKVILNLSAEMLNSKTHIPVVGCIVDSNEQQNDLYDAAVGLGIEAIKVSISNRRIPLDLIKAGKLFKSRKIDLIHSHGYKPSVFGFAIKLLQSIPVISTCHLWFEPQSGPLKMRLMIALEKLAFKWLPKIIAVSKPIKVTIQKQGIRPENVEVIRNGIHIENRPDNTSSAKLRSELGLSTTQCCIINVGRLTRQKAQWNLIHAAEILRDRDKTFKIFIVGEGGMEAELREEVHSAGLDDNVVLLGFRSDISDLLEIADIFALPSLDEGLPIAMLEAIAALTPVVTTAVGDIPDLIEDDVSGLIIEGESPSALAEALLDLMEHPERGQKLAKAAKVRLIDGYSSTAMEKAYANVYSKLLGAA